MTPSLIITSHHNDDNNKSTMIGPINFYPKALGAVAESFKPICIPAMVLDNQSISIAHGFLESSYQHR